MRTKSPVLRVENISKSLGGKEILKDVSLTVDKGELKLLIGPSGGGKSTLLQCINFLIPPDRGRVLLDGAEVHSHRKRDLYDFRRRVGMIFQDFNLFDHLTALDNVAIALRKVKKMARAEARDRAARELARVDLADRMDLYPAELSGGQKQRVSIARALAMDPRVILLDEPTSALDPELIGEVLQVIVDLAKGGMTMIMATHQVGFAKSLTNEILFMEKGRIIERGSPGELLNPEADSRTRDFCSSLSDLQG
ncbi:MAG: amino acid ABC transporter ATP-binding protein [Desulfobacterales bacterium]|nr:amino acid ABC transporter ATP-binding protein [Desulfobacterales bacterium]